MEAIKLTRPEALEIRRKRLGVTQHKLAELARLHPVYGANVLRGRVRSAAALDKMEAVLVTLEGVKQREAA